MPTLPRRNALPSLLVLFALVAAGAVSTWARGGDGSPLTAPPPIEASLAARLQSAAVSAVNAGLPASGLRRRAGLPPTRWIDSRGPCATDDQPKCAAVAVYDYATNAGAMVVLTLDESPAVISQDLGPGVVVDLSPDESSRGFVVAERDPAIQAWLAAGYRPTYTHQFVPNPSDDPCLKVRCVAVDYTTTATGTPPLRTVIVDLTNEQIVMRSAD